MNKKSNIIAVAVLAGVVIIGAGWWTVSASKIPDKVPSSVSSGVKFIDQSDSGKGVSAENTSSSTASGSGGKYVASKNGTKYFPEDCKGSKTIKEANKIFFSTPEEAEKAGYELAKNCKK